MKSNYRRIGDFIRKVNNRNKDLKVTKLYGLSMNKEFRESTSNTVGTNMANYKVMHKFQFACDFMSPIRVNKLPVVLKLDEEPNLVSPAYPVFEVIDINELDPEYLMMWFRRPEFDRYATFKCDAAIRGGYDWEELCNTELPVPSIEKQRAIVKEYNTVVNRIKLNEQLNQKLEATAQALYKHWFVEKNKFQFKTVKLVDVTSLITDGKHGNCQNELNSGYYFLSAKDVRETLEYDNARQITKSDFLETHRRTNLEPKDICMVNTGATIGRMCLAPNNAKTYFTTFQKSVAVIKPKSGFTKGYFLYSLIKYRIEEIIELGKGTSQNNLLLGDLKNFEVKIPDYQIVEKYEALVAPCYELIAKLIYENKLLEKIATLLLSKMSKSQAKIQTTVS